MTALAVRVYPCTVIDRPVPASATWRQVSCKNEKKLMRHVRMLAIKGQALVVRKDSHQWPNPDGYYVVVYQLSGRPREPRKREWPCPTHPRGCP